MKAHNAEHWYICGRPCGEVWSFPFGGNVLKLVLVDLEKSNLVSLADTTKISTFFSCCAA
jgi:hypothetical protein